MVYQNQSSFFDSIQMISSQCTTTSSGSRETLLRLDDAQIDVQPSFSCSIQVVIQHHIDLSAPTVQRKRCRSRCSSSFLSSLYLTRRQCDLNCVHDAKIEQQHRIQWLERLDGGRCSSVHDPILRFISIYEYFISTILYYVMMLLKNNACLIEIYQHNKT